MSAKIVVEGSKRYLSALKTALKGQKNTERVKSALYLKNKLSIVIKAKDATALRACLNTYLRIIQQTENLR